MVSNTPNPKWKEKMGITYEQHLLETFAPSIRMAREFEKTIGKKKTHEIIKNMRERDEAQSARQTGEREHFEDFQGFLSWIKKTYASPYWSHILTYTLKEALQEYWFTCTECLYAKTFRDQGAADLGYIMLCDTDFAATPAFHPKLRLERTKTLMQGDECCNFHCIWEEKG
jgi:desulfoferrodoxin (superoxide reductase-like protein)